MPFGLCNAPATFQAYINETLRDYLDEFCIAYLDDVLIYSSGTLEEHIEQVRKVLIRLKESELYVKLEKCEFHVEKTKFLGYIISPEDIAMDLERVKTIIEWSVPKSQYDLQVFLGFANFYRRFILAYSRIILLFIVLLKKSSKFRWKEEVQEVFDKLKEAFITESVLCHFDSEFSIILHVNSFDAAIFDLINQPHDEYLHPVVFWFWKCLLTECNYDIHDHKMLAIIEFMKYWCYYLKNVKFLIQILSDHKNLEIFMIIKMLNQW